MKFSRVWGQLRIGGSIGARLEKRVHERVAWTLLADVVGGVAAGVKKSSLWVLGIFGYKLHQSHRQSV